MGTAGLLAVTLSVSGIANSLANQLPEEPEVTEADRDHWSFRPIRDSRPPHTSDGHWSRNGIDRFLLAALEHKELRPHQEADRATLARRLSFNLTGLPPEPETVRSFQQDNRPNAYERFVDRLLGSPAYGEHWAQHWLDLARFAETDGFEHDKTRPEAWKYRDWVIRAWNEDMSYDQFVQYQIAGDEMERTNSGDENSQANVATAFCLSGPDMPDINLQEERRHFLLNEMTSTVGSAILGLQMECAQCHDHKYDPISQADFYRLRAFFEPAVQVKKNQSVSTLSNQTPSVSSYLMVRGDFRRRGPEIVAAFPRIANPSNAGIKDFASGTVEQRRLALARWMTQSDHPLTTRVIVNRVWQYHFGKGLSQTPSDFGVLSDEPLHPELLDWLVREFVRNRWSIKHLNRMIVTSSTYRQASHAMAHDSDARARWRDRLSKDPRNVYLSRFPRQRLTGEAIRDAMLVASGTLNRHSGGPGVRPPLAPELVKTLLKKQWEVTPHPAQHHRRSIYVFARRNLRYPIFDAFDRPDANASCPSRGQSTTAPQSLLLLNSDFSLEAARRFAGRLIEQEPHDSIRRIRLAIRIAFGRAATQQEVKQFMAFLAEQSEVISAEGRSGGDLALPLPCPADFERSDAAALCDLCLVLFNANEFLYVD